MKWLSISLIIMLQVACSSKKAISTEQKIESMSLHGAQGLVQIDYLCSDSIPLLLSLDTVHSFRNLAKAQPVANHRGYPHLERLIISTYAADTQRASSAQSQEKVVVTKDSFSFSYESVMIIVAFLSVGILLLRLVK